METFWNHKRIKNRQVQRHKRKLEEFVADCSDNTFDWTVLDGLIDWFSDVYKLSVTGHFPVPYPDWLTDWMMCLNWAQLDIFLFSCADWLTDLVMCVNWAQLDISLFPCTDQLFFFSNFLPIKKGRENLLFCTVDRNFLFGQIILENFVVKNFRLQAWTSSGIL